MPGDTNTLSSKTISVLEMIAAGSTYEQILAAYPDFTYLDIFDAAREALDIRGPSCPRPAYRVGEVRQRYRRAYEKWTDGEDDTVRHLVRTGSTVARIASALQRQRSAIRSRILKLNLVAELPPKEQARLQRTSAFDGVDDPHPPWQDTAS